MGVTAIGRRQHSRLRAHLHFHHAARSGKFQRPCICERGLHECIPNWGGAAHAGEVLSRRPIGITHPYARDKLRRKSDRPTVAVVVSSSRLCRGGTREIERGIGPKLGRPGLAIGEDTRDLIGNARIEHLFDR